ncbi:MAG TPA: cobalt ECF transporter T component CbiQ, partial [Nitrospirota bacterium]|nr:cobalt ECF transporter T component CbiQ [Nitrospirota bacterium]
MASTTFLDKTLLAIADAAEQSLFSEQFANRRGLLQALDIRFQLVTFLFLLVLVSLLHTPQSLWLIYGAGLAIAALSRVPLWFFVKRVWLFVPLFSAAVVLPAVLNIITPGDPLLVLVKLPQSYSCGPYSLPAEITV